MGHFEMQKSEILILVELIDYIPNAVLSKTIIKKTTGNVTAFSFDSGEALLEKKCPYDNFIQVIEGKAEIIVDGNSKILNSGQSIIIPAHMSNSIKANFRFKMISTIIKSGYEDVELGQ
ncbi:cupin domain-containing protein [Echinicola sp. CAU 1574]|uniref:Cupin domain-containing protein n=1 Tax=Echinicola arenosa TaxID=2774144 RepID=A0ABR9AHJ1_9BACT|nr:cupin domain-containing protein [Echinicola arenosa]MBD8488227.1 cupin domain-containing protein [Echinicola arenosa]